jgi:DHA2 family multidrug resistance protein-like MFS transporter
VMLARRELKQQAPLVPLDLLRIRIFALSIATSVCSFCAQMLAFVSLPFLIEDFLHRSAVQTGFLLTPWPIAVAIVAPISGALADRFSAAILGGIGLVFLAIGLLALSLLRSDAGDLDIAWRMMICGMGFGFFQAPNNRTMISSAPRNRSGAAGGMLATARLTGQTAGTTMVAIFLAAWPSGGDRVSLAVGACLALGGAVASLARIGSDTKRSQPVGA